MNNVSTVLLSCMLSIFFFFCWSKNVPTWDLKMAWKGIKMVVDSIWNFLKRNESGFESHLFLSLIRAMNRFDSSGRPRGATGGRGGNTFFTWVKVINRQKTGWCDRYWILVLLRIKIIRVWLFTFLVKFWNNKHLKDRSKSQTFPIRFHLHF